MSSVVTSTWSDNVTVLAPWALITGESKRVTWDLRAKRGGMLFLAIGFGGSTDLTVSPSVIIRRVLNTDGAAPRYADGIRLSSGYLDTAYRLINNGAGYAIGATSIAFDGHAGKAAALEDKWFFWGVTAIPGASGAISPAQGCEVHRTSKGTATPLVIDSPLAYAHADNEYIGLAQSWSIPLQGGSLYEIIFDNGGTAAGEAIACMANGQTYDSDLVT